MNAEQMEIFDAVRRALRRADQANEFDRTAGCQMRRVRPADVVLDYGAVFPELVFGVGMLGITVLTAILAAAMDDLANGVMFASFALICLMGLVRRFDRIGRALRAKSECVSHDGAGGDAS